MCYSISSRKKAVEIEKRFDAAFEYREVYEPENVINGFAQSQVAIITQEEPNLIKPGLWGLLPSNMNESYRDFQKKYNTLNAKKETLLSSKLYAEPTKRKRCLIIADGFFEPHEFNGVKYPYFIQLKSKGSFAFAGIYNEFGGHDVLTCSIITAPANDFMAKIHNVKKRMPVVLDKEFEWDWLSNQLTENGVMSLLNTFTTEELEAYPISRDFYKRNYNNYTILNKVNYPELEQTKLF